MDGYYAASSASSEFQLSTAPGGATVAVGSSVPTEPETAGMPAAVGALFDDADVAALASIAVPRVEDPLVDDDAQDLLGRVLSSVAGTVVVVLGVGSWAGSRAPLTLMAPTGAALATSCDVMSRCSGMRVMGKRWLRVPDEDDGEDRTVFPSGYWLAWLMPAAPRRVRS